VKAIGSLLGFDGGGCIIKGKLAEFECCQCFFRGMKRPLILHQHLISFLLSILITMARVSDDDQYIGYLDGALLNDTSESSAYKSNIRNGWMGG
jgi:hypothetical protein